MTTMGVGMVVTRDQTPWESKMGLIPEEANAKHMMRILVGSRQSFETTLYIYNSKLQVTNYQRIQCHSLTPTNVGMPE